MRRGADPVLAFDRLLSGPPPKRVRRVDRWFPDRQFIIRSTDRVSAVHLSQRWQLGIVGSVLALLVGFVGAAAHAAWMRHVEMVMEGEMASLRDSAQAEAARAEADRELLRRLGHELDEQIAERDRAAHAPDSPQMQAQRQAAINRLLAEREATIQRVVDERARLIAERDAALAARDVAVAANQQTLARLDDQTKAAIDEVQKIITSTGLDPQRLAPVKEPAHEDRNAPRGGPFVPFQPLKTGDAGQVTKSLAIVGSLDQLQRLTRLLEHMPLASPVPHTEVSSPFGYRIDPFTNQAALHEGIDLRGPQGTPIYATAPGVVSYAGWKYDYGQTVDIEHGFGLMTRYAHLSRLLVKPGDTVVLHQKIGLMGATGRATGAHLHYETHVNGQVQNPIHFLKADHYVP